MFCTLRPAAAVLITTLLLSPFAPARQSQPQAPASNTKPKSLIWDPPKLDAKLRSAANSSPCDLDKVLAQAADRATELIDNLQNFTAREQLDFRTYGPGGFGDNRGGGSAAFDYTATISKRGTSFAVKESRKAAQAAIDFPLANQDIGLPEMALIFFPTLRAGYEMKCDAAADWSGRAAWVVSFRQRKDRPDQTAAFTTNQHSYPAPLRGRAWIAQDTGVVLHMEIALMHEIAAVDVREWFLSIAYAPVRFHSKDVTVWLPQSAHTWAAFDLNRVVVSHDFSDFFLFSVQTTQALAPPTR
ncbi:MAG TPA: hypothetical protein VN933_01425 [Candidatus Eremiobacteraceae bacterium]|jgi:hypothetical protein|nr:hypothetical protein [Candidatus Eremiobacteraceae bacterium]